MRNSIYSILWDGFCALSIVGIWPRFIEPRLLSVTSLHYKLLNLPPALKGFKILQFSDLHFSARQPSFFLDRLFKKIEKLAPDLILFTGDFLCYGKMEDPARLKQFLNRLKAPYGCFAVLGNHDYANCVSVNSSGDYDLVEPEPSLNKAFSRLTQSIVLTRKVSTQARKTPFNQDLINLLKETPFTLLHNETKLISVGDTKLNICGLGEHMLGKTVPSEAYLNYNPAYPGMILLHNPDGSSLLKNYPGNIIFSGHTHGGQVNLPWIWKKFTLMENISLKKGWHQIDGKQIYINRGLSGIIPFRFCSMPEILLLTLE